HVLGAPYIVPGRHPPGGRHRAHQLPRQPRRLLQPSHHWLFKDLYRHAQLRSLPRRYLHDRLVHPHPHTDPYEISNVPTQRGRDMTKGLRKGLTSYGDADFSLFLRKAFIKAMGYSDDALERPIVGITNTFSYYNPCHGNVP